MATQAQINANRANAQHSTGPTSAEGRATSARNSVTHGLSAESVCALSEEDQIDFDNLRNRLRPQLQPLGVLEEEIFQAHTWSLYQSDRARAYEAWAQSQWEMEMENEAKFRLLERISQHRQRQERSAARSLKELGAIQANRFAANQPNKVLAWLGHTGKTLSAALPVWQFRKKSLSKANPFSVANEEVFGYPKTPPPHPGDGLSSAELAQIKRMAAAM